MLDVGVVLPFEFVREWADRPPEETKFEDTVERDCPRAWVGD